jgi:divalent metal cation (Fe/Co/Zn/Cd) transporter
VLVPGTWTVHRGHELAERIESDIRSALRDAEVLTHLESLDGRASSENREQQSLRSDDIRGKARDEKKP